MTYGISNALQSAVYQRLLGDVTINGLVGDAVYDAVPTGPKPNTYITLGEEDVRDFSDLSGAGAVHRFRIAVVTETAGYSSAKVVAAAISDALVDADLTLSRGRLVSLAFERATARRSGKAGRVRQINLRFRARVEEN